MKIMSWWSLVRVGFNSLMMHKLRSSLTILGIVFGVASVITMLAVGEGASAQAQERIKSLGSSNIILESVKPESLSSASSNRILEYGVTAVDLERISHAIEGVDRVIPARTMNHWVRFQDHREKLDVVGTSSDFYQTLGGLKMSGRFLCALDDTQQLNVCVLNRGLADKLFLVSEPIGQYVDIGGHNFEVVGVLEDKSELKTDSEMQCYIPMATMQSRFGETEVVRVGSSVSGEKVAFQKLIVQMESGDAVMRAESQIRRIIAMGHDNEDVKMVVPIKLLKEAEATKRMFNIVLGSIAAISLIVGGIGVMNIMLATVTERTREIGLRRALGAKKIDIIQQFMVEATLLSLCGGLIGIVLGVVLPFVIQSVTEMNVVISLGSILVAFLVSAAIGLVFGIYPAAKSAQLDPIEALRNE